jgi:succinate-semialdehyde dehydrogenase/glutarate-semialdehyde dehydrogenase
MATVQPLKSAIDRQPEQLMLIDGERVHAASGRTINVFDPSTGRLIGTVPDGAQADIERAVDAATRAFRGPAWSGLSGQARARILSQGRAGPALSSTITRDLKRSAAGPRRGHAVHAAVAAELLRYGRLVRGLRDDGVGAAPSSSAHAQGPVGVCGFITPWNADLADVPAMAPALAAGCRRGNSADCAASG